MQAQTAVLRIGEKYVLHGELAHSRLENPTGSSLRSSGIPEPGAAPEFYNSDRWRWWGSKGPLYASSSCSKAAPEVRKGHQQRHKLRNMRQARNPPPPWTPEPEVDSMTRSSWRCSCSALMLHAMPSPTPFECPQCMPVHTPHGCTVTRHPLLDPHLATTTRYPPSGRHWPELRHLTHQQPNKNHINRIMPCRGALRR